MPGPAVAQAGAPGIEAQSTASDENMSCSSRSSESQERQDGLVSASPQADDRDSPDSLSESQKVVQPEPQSQSGTAASSSPAPPPSSPLQPSAGIQIRLNDDPALGFCVFALQRYAPGDVLYTERSALEATHDVYKEGPRDVYQVYRRYMDGRKQKLHGSFPYLAWANNVDPYEAAECRHLITSNVTSKNVRIDIQLSAADHIRMRPDSALILPEEEVVAPVGAEAGGAGSTGTNAVELADGSESAASSVESPVARAVSVFSSFLAPLAKWPLYGLASETPDPDAAADAALAATNKLSPPATRKKAQAETVSWFSRYAFRLQPEHAFPGTGKNHQAAVYLLTDLINHRCNRLNNCRVKTMLGKVSLVAEKTIQPGEEITIDYNKDVKDFVCRAECCAPSSLST
ncbi:set domain containing protein [Ophiostoma piceae UAMH 11346]|uniref:Set domain containing protein n=1 Tax=Ophiostoma piceae (strain UAMH 11346) TaxID=1262450 RepID=S3CAE5_OPHP1|nr:set domain containing protein [Ophiostoma piceae UAMH 11346]